jgi:hypothetical protein
MEHSDQPPGRTADIDAVRVPVCQGPSRAGAPSKVRGISRQVEDRPGRLDPTTREHGCEGVGELGCPPAACGGVLGAGKPFRQ